MKSLPEIIEAFDVVMEELRFHADRLSNAVKPDTSEEKEHLADLREGYLKSLHYVGILRRYQQGRLSRLAPRPRDPTGPWPLGDAHVDDNEG